MSQRPREADTSWCKYLILFDIEVLGAKIESELVVIWVIIFAELSVDVGRSHSGNVGNEEGDQLRGHVLEHRVVGVNARENFAVHASQDFGW